MVYENPARVEAHIRRLNREHQQIDDYFYGWNKDKDRALYLSMLEHKRNDIVRAAVLQIHTSIEDLLNEMLLAKMLGFEVHKKAPIRRSKRGLALKRVLFGGGSIGFDTKLSLAVAVGIINSQLREQLRELNTLRNKCSHNWLLNVAVRHGKKSKGTKPRLLNFRGRDLHKVGVFKDFSAEYGRVYLRLFGRTIK